MRKLVREERPAVEDVQPEEPPEAEAQGPLAKARAWEGVRGRAESEQIEKERLVVSTVAPRQEAALGRPAVREKAPARERPAPVRPAVERPAPRPDLALFGRAAVEERGARESPREEDRGVHRGKLAAKSPAPRAHVEEVVV